MIFATFFTLFCYIGDLPKNVCDKKIEKYFLNEELDRLKALKENNPQDLKIRFDIAKLYHELKMNLLAKEELLFILSKDSEDEEAKNLAMEIFREELKRKKEWFYSSDKKEVLDLARSYFSNQQIGRAIQTYKHLLKEESSLVVLKELGEIYVSIGNISEAVVYFEKAYKMKPTIELRKKLAVLLTWSKKYDEALTLLLPLYKKEPENSDLAILVAEVYISKDDLENANFILEKQLKTDPENVALLSETADVLAYRGYVLQAKKIYENLIETGKDSRNILQKYASIMQLWGDFSVAEKIYKTNLLDDNTNNLQLAKLYVSTERYYEAEAIYRKLQLSSRTYVLATIELAKTKILEKDFDQGYLELCSLLNKYPFVEEAKLLKAEVLYESKKYPEAKEAYLELIAEKIELQKAYLGIGKVFLKEENFEDAEIYLKKAQEINSNYEVIFYLWQAEKRSLKDQKEILEMQDFSSKEITKISDLYLIKGDAQMSLELLQEIIKKDKEYYPAYLSLIQTYEYLHDYDNALKIIEKLLNEDIHNYKMLLWKARVLGWSNDYEESLNDYSELEQLSPDNSVLIREKARVAMWDKKFDLAMRFYNSIFKNKVDLLLQTKLLKVLKDGTVFYQDVENLCVSIFEGYEKLWSSFFGGKYHLDAKEKLEVEKIFMDLFGIYKNQKAFYLEKNAKTLVWNKRHAQALIAYKNLINFEKNNEEAFFDLGQVQCELRMCDLASETFEELIDIDPLHDRAHIALDREEIKSHAEIALNGTFWKEKGRGDLDQIMRNRLDSSAIFPINCENHFSVTENHYFETPFFNNKTYNADGFTVAYSAITSPYLRADVGFAKKYYWQSFKNTTQGLADLFFNLNDYVHLQLGYLRKDHLENLFCLEQRTQESNYKIGLGSFITHKLDMALEGTYVKFTDGNRGQYCRGDLGYRLTEHPKILKFQITAEYRNLKEQNIFIFNSGGSLVNIIFPYWTPDHYKSGRFLIDFYSDLSKYFFCASQLHYYELKCSYGYDSEKNPAFEVDGEWHIEFSDHYTFSITGLIYRSKLWKADGLWVNFNYRF